MIPRTIHQVWIGGPMPGHLVDYMVSWREHHPDWEYRLWDNNAVAELDMRNRDLYERADTFAMPGRGNQVRSDILRYEILSRFGGVYVDADFEALRPIDSLLEGVACFAGWEVPGMWVNMALSGAEPRHPFIEACILGLRANIARYDGRAAGITSSTSLSGPRYLTPIYRKHRDTVTVFPQPWFYPYSWRDIGTARAEPPWPDAYAVHHWLNRRRLKGEVVLEGVDA